MRDAMPPGHFSRSPALRSFKHLLPGAHYLVRRDFVDFDGDLHPVGESWRFLGSSFLPHEDGLSLFVSLDGEREWQIRLQWRKDAQGPIINVLEDHVGPA